MTTLGHLYSVGEKKADFRGKMRDFKSGLTVTNGHAVCDLAYLCVSFSGDLLFPD